MRAPSRIKTVASLAAVAFAAGMAWAGQVQVRASVNRTQVPLNGQLQLKIEVTGTQQAEAPSVTVEGFGVRYVGPATQISIVNGQVSASVTHVYLLTAQKEGRWIIGPVAVRAEGQLLQTDPIAIEVTAAPPAGPLEAAAKEVLQLQIGVDRTQAYVNDSIPARVQLLIGAVAVQRIETPALQAEGFQVGPIRQAKQSQILVGDEPMTLMEFETELVALRAGNLTVGPASLVCQVVELSRSPMGGFFEDFFAQPILRNITLTAEPVAITVLARKDSEKTEGSAAPKPPAADKLAAAPPVAAPISGQTIGISIKETRWFWLALIIALPVLLITVRRFSWGEGQGGAGNALKRAQATCQTARRLGRQGKVAASYAELFQVIHRYAADRWGLNPETLSRTELMRHCLAYGIKEDRVKDLIVCLDRCEAARLAPASVASDQLESVIALTESVLKQL